MSEAMIAPRRWTAQNDDKVRGDKSNARRIELAEAALETLSELGYARTSLREIAQKSDFSHGVLHYYFTDKTDLICCAVRHYKTNCATRYDALVAAAQSPTELVENFLVKMRESLCSEAHMHRLWYDLRSQALYDAAYRKDVTEIDTLLEAMVWRIASRYAELCRKSPAAPSHVLYALLDGMFQRALLAYVGGDHGVADRLVADVRPLFGLIAQPDAN
ncbi:transcriptional regulator BetI [Variibacter gotjawalensis]|uniref:Transcriptional regulator BetI n=1 Tax=Variibacter gotjawalensis TaxID=1333996 RepID=A0A0S3PWY8_9BRAD|nr:TetR/AcrR family transcriptional regulator [Variibacter gotjawalensis]NIK46130.1 AcrR family transcriptional regulator [Variibacter gotjawalensis]RZS48048.1 TetR family transcriptional regulator [Variibacter gotjawalensis]BAT60304.1 transcriptional regulator BetI [Variibacter gotjawalensis]